MKFTVTVLCGTEHDYRLGSDQSVVTIKRNSHVYETIVFSETPPDCIATLVGHEVKGIIFQERIKS